MADDITTDDTGAVIADEITDTPTGDNATGGEERTPLEKARAEARNLRDRAKAAEARADLADDLARRLHTALVAADGRLHDVSDLPYAAEHLDDTQALTVAIDNLLAAKPHLRARRIQGDAGLGVKGADAAPQDFSTLFA